MIKIDLHNYEEFAIDYMSGELSQEYEQAFVAFLGEHPDIADEILLFNFDPLTPSDDETIDLNHLHKDLNETNINRSNFEEFCIASAEGDLNTKALKALNLYIGNNISFRKVEDQYKHLKLKTGNEIYEHKDTLKKKDHKAIFLKRIIFLASASAAAVILFISLLLPQNFEETKIQKLVMIDGFKEFKVSNKEALNPQVIVAKSTQTPIEVKSEDSTKGKMGKESQKQKESIRTSTELAKEPLKKLEAISRNAPIKSLVGLQQIALANTNKDERITSTNDNFKTNDFKQQATNYVYTKVLTKGIENINRMAETNINYQVVENENGAPVRIVFSTRFGKINHTLAQR